MRVLRLLHVRLRFRRRRGLLLRDGVWLVVDRHAREVARVALLHDERRLSAVQLVLADAHASEDALRVLGVPSVDGETFGIRHRALEERVRRSVLRARRNAVRALLDEDDVRYHVRPGVLLELPLRKTERADDVALAHQLPADGGVRLVHRELRRDRGDYAVRLELLHRMNEEEVV